MDDVKAISLVSHIKECLNRGYANFTSIKDRMLDGLRYYKNEYTQSKKMQIQEVGQPPVFLPLTNIKVRALKAWLTDVFFAEVDEPPFDVIPTPLPDSISAISTDDDYSNDLESKYQSIMDLAQQVYSLSNGKFPIDTVISRLPEMLQNDKKAIITKKEKYLKDLAEKEKKRIYDQFVEGGFFEALDDILLDIAIFPVAIMKACVPRSVKSLVSPQQSEYKVIPTFNRVSPFDIFVSPDVADFSDWVIEILHLTPKDLINLKKVEGFDEDAIDLVIGLYGESGYVINIHDTEEDTIENKDTLNSGTIDIIEFWGNVKGSLLTDFISDIDVDEYYDIAAWVCDDTVLKVTLNPDPLGLKPYTKVSFVSIPSSFWGLSLVDVLRDIQDVVNSLGRAIVTNSALSSGPLVERNIDRIPANAVKQIRPWEIFDSHDLAMNSAPAYKFYQPNLTAGAIVQVLAYYMKLADELSGVPAYSHSLVGGSGTLRTSSGLSMMMESSSRGIKDVVKVIDRNIIEATVKRQYYYNLTKFYDVNDEVPDLNIRAKGSATLAHKISQTNKILQLLQITNNPVDSQLIGLEARRLLLETLFSGFGVNIPIDSGSEELIKSLQQQMAANMKQQTLPQQSVNMQIPNEYQTQANEMQANIMTNQPPNEGGF